MQPAEAWQPHPDPLELQHKIRSEIHYGRDPRDQHKPGLSLPPSHSQSYGGTEGSRVGDQHGELGRYSQETQTSQKNPVFKIPILPTVRGRELVCSCAGERLTGTDELRRRYGRSEAGSTGRVEATDIRHLTS